MPQPEDVPRYVAGKNMEGVEASPEELGWLLLCDGSRTVREIALQENLAAPAICAALAKFRMHGVIEIAARAPGVSGPESAQDAGDSNVRKPRYWRGKLVE